MQEVITNAKTGEVTIRDFTAAEIAARTPDPATVLKEMRAAVDAERNKRLVFPFEFNGVMYDRDIESVKRIGFAGVLALGAMVGGARPGDLRWHGGDVDFGWIALDNSITPMDAQTVFAFGQAAARVESALIFIANGLKRQNPIPKDYASEKYWP